MDVKFNKHEERQHPTSGRLTPKIVLNANLLDQHIDSKIESSKNTTKYLIGRTTVMRKESKSLNGKLSCNEHDESSVKSEDNDETKQLKGLLLVHLDLIQQQQELLLSKDRIITSLQAEKDALKCRLDRMERRMSLAKHRATDAKEFKQDPSDITNKSAKRRALLEPRNLSKRFAASETNKQTDRDKPETKRSNTPTKAAKRDLSEARISHRPRRVTTEKEQTSSRPQFITEPKDEVKKEPKQIESVGDNTIFRTASLYYSIPYRDIEPPDEDVGDRIKNVLSVEVPSWRLNPVQNRYVIEGTENLEDETFMKRHQKLEIDEKRRKRWDLQRSREQALYERLKQGYRCAELGHGTVRERDDNVSSFYPDPDDIGFIEVADEIPVSAFGYPIPELSSIEFEVPWLESYNKEERPRHSKGRRK